MDVGKGWPRAAHDSTIINRIMLRFRPIAPKPVSAGAASDSASAASKTGPVTKRRAKRKYVRVKKNNKCKSPSNNYKEERVVEEVEKQKDLIRFDVSLQLQTPLPIICGTKLSPDIGPSNSNNGSFLLEQRQPILTNFDNRGIFNLCLADQSDRRAAVGLVESWVVVDGAAEALPDAGGLGSTDTEKMANLELDTCPGLISDAMYRVQWVNLAYKRMVDPDGGGREGAVGEPPAEVVVRLVLKQNIPAEWPMFACTVRVVYTWRKEKLTRTMPCDVWKMDFGGLAWRLDAAAALSLGR
ncbi:unnamed protein product [Coffea canephora]|uniref:DUF7950 domain-containing protein n=1 Tax=Coffea canephora TaxID=49390 RepID=A0A068V7M5_COFCA|nr:unnamed protein product [Coffea canephora]